MIEIFAFSPANSIYYTDKLFFYFFQIHLVILRRISARGNKQHQMISTGQKIVVLLLPLELGHLLDTVEKVRE